MRKKGKVLSLNKLNVLSILKCDRIKLVLYIISAIGMILGFLLYSNDSNSGALAAVIFKKLVTFKIGNDFFISLLTAIGSLLCAIVLSIVFGSSVFGVVIIPGILLFINCIFGAILSFSYQNYRINGLAFNSVLLIPTYSIFLIALIISLSAVLKYSLCQINALTKANNLKTANEFYEMLKRQLVVLSIIVADSVLEVILNRLFIKSFDFLKS